MLVRKGVSRGRVWARWGKQARAGEWDDGGKQGASLFLIDETTTLDDVAQCFFSVLFQGKSLELLYPNTNCPKESSLNGCRHAFGCFAMPAVESPPSTHSIADLPVPTVSALPAIFCTL
jgi:hypothetical protein